MQIVKAYRWYIVFFILILAFIWAADFNGLYGQDSYEYLRYSKSLLLFFKTGANPGAFFWPLIYPIIGALFSLILKPIIALQLLSVIAFIGAAIYIKKIIIVLYKPCEEYANRFTFLFFLLSPYMLRASMVVMSDMLCVFFLSAAFYYFINYRSFKTGNYFFGFTAFSIASIATRYSAAILLVVPAFLAIVIFIRSFNWKIFLSSLVVTVILILPHVLLRFNQPLGFMDHYLFKGWNLINLFKNSFYTTDGYEHDTVCNIIYCFYNWFHPAFCFAGLVLIIFSVKYFRAKGIRDISVILVSILLYALFLAAIPFQDLRFLLLSFPLVAVLLFPGFKYLMDNLIEVRSWSSKKIWIVYGGIALIQLALFCRVFKPFYHYNKVEKEIATEVLKYPGPSIYTFSIDGALQAYGVTNKIINLYKVKLDTIALVAGDKLALFNEAEFAEEWKGKNPMNNWNYIKSHFALIKVEELPDGWILYKSH